MSKDLSIVADFSSINKDDIVLAGGKGANLGELTQAGFCVPDGFVITAAAYRRVLEFNQLIKPINALLKPLNHHDTRQLNQTSQAIKQLILRARIPPDIALTIINNYIKLGHGSNHALVAVRSSATAEDLPGASFAGQQESFLNIFGEANLIQNVRRCWASLFNSRAIFYREEKHFDHFQTELAVIVQQMIQSQVSGIIFTVNPITNEKNQIVIEAIWGLGEKIVQGEYTPDHYLVQKLTWKILQKQINPQSKALILTSGGNKEIKLSYKKSLQPKLTDKQIIKLAQIAHRLQLHYFYPQDIEWAIDKDKFYVVQSRPITTLTEQKVEITEVKSGLKLLFKGEPASPGIVAGFVRILHSAKDINQLKPQEILVTGMTSPDYVPAMKKAAGIVTDKGGQTSHAAIVSRELGIPCIVGTGTATKQLNTGSVITLNGSSGEIFQGGKQSFRKSILKPDTKINPKKYAADITATATKLYVNLGEPDLAAAVALKNTDGVGLLRAEFMLAQLGIHPKKLIHDGRSEKLVSYLSEGMLKFCRAFFPRPVVYRTTDFKTNEYRNLLGGKAYEPQEANPLIGWRGVCRYVHDPKVFNLELKAIKQVRDKLKFSNLWLMLPFVRTVSEFTAVKKIISSQGLNRSATFKLWLMAEIPANVLLLDQFIDQGVDGISIGSNDLAMLTLGVDRDNEELAPLYDEMDPAVLLSLQTIITTCKKRRVTCSICGQAPSLRPDLTQKLVEWGITSVSVSPDMVEQTRNIIYEAEKRLVYGKNR